MSVAKAAGLPAPETAELHTSQDVDRWLSQTGLPTVLKVDGSWGGNGVFVVESRAEAHRIFGKLSQPCPHWVALKRRIVNRDPYWLPEARRHIAGAVSAQTYIKGSPGNCAVFCWNGHVLAGIAAEVLETRHPCAPATVIRVVDRPEMLHAARTLAARLRLSGFFGLDFMIDSETDVSRLIELNARPTPLCHLRLGPGRDLVGALIATLSHLPVSEIMVTTSDVIAYFPDAIRVNAGKLPAGAYHDIPTGAPALVAELLRRPWPNRSLLAREFEWWVGVVNSGTRLVRRSVTRASQKSSVDAVLEQHSGTPAIASGKVD
jgi:biotin carboxylase